MVKCANCEEEFSKYMTQEVDVDTFSTLMDKIEDTDKVRICENCYDELSKKLEVGQSGSTHPYLRDDTED